MHFMSSIDYSPIVCKVKAGDIYNQNWRLIWYNKHYVIEAQKEDSQSELTIHSSLSGDRQRATFSLSLSPVSSSPVSCVLSPPATPSGSPWPAAASCSPPAHWEGGRGMCVCACENKRKDVIFTLHLFPCQ